jgi:PAS domain S-box-containing protein
LVEGFQFRAAFDAAPFAALLTDAAGKYIYVNRAACEMLGFTRSQLLGSNFLTTLYPENLEQDIHRFKMLQRGEIAAFRAERRCFHQSGRLSWIEITSAPVRDPSGRVLYYVAHLEDVTARRYAEAEKERLQDIVRRAETMSAMGALVGGVAHEVRNPLFAITATLDAMENRLGNRPEYTRYVNVLRSEAARMTELMQRLLAYGKPLTVDQDFYSLADVIRESIRICEITAKPRSVQLIFELAIPADLTMRMDAQRLTAAFQNVIDNAIHFSPDGGQVTVRVDTVADESAPTFACCTVRDSGPGFHPGDEERVFQPFYTRRTGGTGLGLSIVQKTVHEHGGEISARNHQDGGAVVAITLPLTDQA